MRLRLAILVATLVVAISLVIPAFAQTFPDPQLWAQTKVWCPSCQDSESRPLVEVSGVTNPRGIKYVANVAGGRIFNIPANTQIDWQIWDGFTFRSSSGAYSGQVVEATFRFPAATPTPTATVTITPTPTPTPTVNPSTTPVATATPGPTNPIRLLLPFIGIRWPNPAAPQPMADLALGLCAAGCSMWDLSGVTDEPGKVNPRAVFVQVSHPNGASFDLRTNFVLDGVQNNGARIVATGPGYVGALRVFTLRWIPKAPPPKELSDFIVGQCGGTVLPDELAEITEGGQLNTKAAKLESAHRLGGFCDLPNNMSVDGVQVGGARIVIHGPGRAENILIATIRLD